MMLFSLICMGSLIQAGGRREEERGRRGEKQGEGRSAQGVDSEKEARIQNTGEQR